MKIKIVIYLLSMATIAGISALISTYFSAKETVRYKNRIEVLQHLTTKYSEQKAQYLKAKDSLKVKLKTADSLLAIAKEKSARIKEKIIYKIKPVRVVQKEVQTVAQALEDCDSLKTLLVEYISVQDDKDRIQGSIDTTVYRIFDLKDKQIQDCDSAFKQVSKALSESMEREMTYESEIYRLQKKQKRNAFFGKFTGTLTLIALGFTGYHLITK